MAIPVVESSSTGSSTASSSVTIAKPTGLVVGDLLLVTLAASDISAENRTWSTPAGWTAIEVGGTTSNSVPAAYYIVATSTETAASNFTFSMSGTTTSISGCLMRISGQNASPIGDSEIDQTSGSVTAMTFTTALTPVSPNSLLIFSYTAAGNAFAGGTPAMGSYVSTPSETWTEVADVGIKDGLDDGHGFGVAQADYEDTGLTEITSRGATVSLTANIASASIAIAVSGTYDQTGTNALLEVSPTQFSQAGRADTNATSALHEVSPTLLTQSGAFTTPTVWTNETKPSTTWVNEQK